MDTGSTLNTAGVPPPLPVMDTVPVADACCAITDITRLNEGLPKVRRTCDAAAKATVIVSATVTPTCGWLSTASVSVAAEPTAKASAMVSALCVSANTHTTSWVGSTKYVVAAGVSSIG